MPHRACPGDVRVVSIALTAFAAALVPVTPPASADPVLGTIEVEAKDATAHDRKLLAGVARELERNEHLWTSPPPRGTKTFRLKTYARGSVRGLTELGSSVDHVAACKLLRNRLWPLKLRSTAPRAVTVTFRFRPTRS